MRGPSVTKAVVRCGHVAGAGGAALQNFDLPGARPGAKGCAPPMTLLGITRLAIPGLMVEIEATAAA